MAMTLTKVRRIGNSKGILLPKTVLDESGITGTVKITVKNKVIMISSAEGTKKKTWADFKKAKKVKADFIVNKFDSEEWVW
jgi:antitoxin MazE